MAYQNVGRPRFFIDNYQYLRALGLDPLSYLENEQNDYEDNYNRINYVLENPSAFTLNPTNYKTFSNVFEESPDDLMRFYIPCGNLISKMDFSGNMKWYTAILNHNFYSNEINLQNMMFMSTFNYNANLDYVDENHTGILNYDDAGVGSQVTYQITCYDGSTIVYSDNVPTSARFTGFELKRPFSGFDVRIGAISTGVMYTMPHSPDLNLKMSIENDGYKSVTTSGGSTLTNIKYTGSPNWINIDDQEKATSMPPFSIRGSGSNSSWGDPWDHDHVSLKRNGRRTWEMKFSLMSDKDLFPSNFGSYSHTENTSNYDASDIDTDSNFEHNMFTDDSFIAQVWNKTCGGALPFIFQPNSENDNPDQFYMARFDQDTLEITQTAHQVYDISVKITEVW